MNTSFDLSGKIALVTGGGGTLGGNMALALAQNGAIVGVMGRTLEKLEEMVATIEANGGQAFSIATDVLNESDLEKAKNFIIEKYGKLDILINAAGGNMPGATIMPEQDFFNAKQEDLQKVLNLNVMGTFLPSKVFAELFAIQKNGVIINISSAAADRPLTRVVGYSASKAAIDNFTRWMAVEMATKYGEGIRVNAIAPGFFIGEQNRKLLLTDEGDLTTRGETIIAHTPMGRFGNPDDLNGTLIWLCSDASKFVTGVVVHVDGGFGAKSI
ncbi:SDR family oxidoreductase [Flavobacterium algicola]|uniref:SDR family oxidoreductase n=1 Tax=Flavobacterium algicola TaxID=556529 RepID=UPI001EFEAC54|nr:SDR family oxidoreductase [Flavobacterium algicola]MCG9790878.1 SDR family oxidoreductase [Flavobacterium algicola]